MKMAKSLGHLIEVLREAADPSPTRTQSTDSLKKRGLKALEKTPSGRSAGPSDRGLVMYGAIDFVPPKSVQAAAKKGLELRKKREALRDAGEIGRSDSLGGTDIGVGRAIQLSSGGPVTPRAIRRIANYLSRHRGDSAAEGFGDDDMPSPGYVAWLLWGGDPAVKWSEGVLAKMDAADKKAK
jgi:hypothetical protein